MSAITFNESLILRIDKQQTNTEILSTLADRLYELKLVKDTFKKAILDREAEYPTGLFTGNINVAIPHTDIANVNKAAICVGILGKPVKFHAMDKPAEEIDVRLVIMLALTEAHGHIDILKRVIELIQNQELANKIVESKDSKLVYDIIKKQLL